MADDEMSSEEECHPENPLNHGEGNLRDGEIWVDLNDSQDNKSELQRTVKELRYELRKVKEDNKRILKAREEINVILLAKIHNDEKEKISSLNKKYLKPHLTSIREESWNFPAINLKLLVKSQLNVTENSKSQVTTVIITKRKINTDPMRISLESLRKLSHPCLMGKLRREKRKKPGCP